VIALWRCQIIAEELNNLMKPYSDIAELIEMLTSEIESLTNKITTLKQEPQSFNEQILFKYIDTGSTGKTKDFVRSLGVKAERGSFFSSGDVSKLIKDGADDVSPELLDIARKVVSMKKKGGMHR
jgi:chromosome segregation ATPase